MSETRYTDQHEWVRLEGDNATPGGATGYSYAHTIGPVRTTNDRAVVLSP